MVIFTVNNPLVYLQTARLGSVEQRWVSQLENFNYTIKCRPGWVNVNADVLSRLPSGEQDDPDQATLDVVPDATHNMTGPQTVAAVTLNSDTEECQWGWDPKKWKALQEREEVLSRVWRYVKIASKREQRR